MTSQLFFFSLLPILVYWKIKRLLTIICQLFRTTCRDFEQHRLSVSLAFTSQKWLPARPRLHFIVTSPIAVLCYRELLQGATCSYSFASGERDAHTDTRDGPATVDYHYPSPLLMSNINPSQEPTYYWLALELAQVSLRCTTRFAASPRLAMCVIVNSETDDTSGFSKKNNLHHVRKGSLSSHRHKTQL